MFTIQLSTQKHATDRKITRNAVRAIIFENQQLLMVKTNKGDYKFPGGGIKEGETREQALVREVLEETGYHVQEVVEKMGTYSISANDRFEHDVLFINHSTYFLCRINAAKIEEQQLETYEELLGFEMVWCTVEEAIHSNLIALKKPYKNEWVERELTVLTMLMRYL